MNSKKVRDAARRAFEKLSNLTDEEFQRELALHVDGDVAKALLDLHYSEVGEAESDAFQFQVKELPDSQVTWHEITHFEASRLFDYSAIALHQGFGEISDFVSNWKDATFYYDGQLVKSGLSGIRFGRAPSGFVAQFADLMNANVDADSYVITSDSHGENQEQKPWPLAA